MGYVAEQKRRLRRLKWLESHFAAWKGRPTTSAEAAGLG